jgi:hypothetical protein
MSKVSVNQLFVTIAFVAAFSSCGVSESDFEFRKTDQGFELNEKGKALLFYQQAPKTLTGEYICNNYIHPLYNLNGDILTEEFPPDHPYHRGVFLAWHQLYLDTVSIGNGWINEGISQDVVKVSAEAGKKQAEMNLEVLWKSSALPDDEPFMMEKSTIVVHPAEKDIRKIDFTIELNALIDKLEIGGSDDPKGYGGFCLRLDIPENMVFTSETGTVRPQELQISAGPWMDFSGSFGKDQEISGVAILCHPDNPLFPSPWILRQKSSMQNAVFPGRERIKLFMNKPVTLKYRLVIHNGAAQTVNLNELQAEYSGI